MARSLVTTAAETVRALCPRCGKGRYTADRVPPTRVRVACRCFAKPNADPQFGGGVRPPALARSCLRVSGLSVQSTEHAVHVAGSPWPAVRRRDVLVAALTPFQQAIDPRGGLADGFGDFALGCALLLSSRDIFSGGTQRGLAGLNCTLRSAQQLGDAQQQRPRRERDFFRRFSDAVVVCSSATTGGMLLVGEL